MENPFLDYLNLLTQLKDELSRLSDLAKQKTSAVRASDLMALDEVIRQEQASSLSFRGLEQKQNALLQSTGLAGIPLSVLSEHYPPKLRHQAKQVTEALQTQYNVYQHCAEVARNTLEMNLHEIDKVLAAANVAPL